MKPPKRRQRGSGSIFRKLPCKKWIIQFYKDGRRIREATGTTDWAEAAKTLRQRLHEIDQNKYVARKGKPARIEELHAALKEDTEMKRRTRAALDLQGRWKHLKPAFGAIRAANLTTDEIRHYIRARQEEGAANATINRELATLKRMFNFGRQCTPPKVQTVPYIPMLKESNVRRGFVEDADFSRLTAAASELWMRTFLELGYSYGWRRGELLGLRVRQVDLRARTIRLDVGSTKNGEGREVVMTKKVEELLRMAVARKGPDDFVLTRTDPKGKPAGRPVRDFRAAWRKLCLQAGVAQMVCTACEQPVTSKKCECGNRKRKYRGLIVHDLRRSGARALRAAGVPESVIMEIGGWRTASMFRRYAIVSPEDRRVAVEKLERARAENEAKRAHEQTENSPFSAPLGQNPPQSTSGKVQ